MKSYAFLFWGYLVVWAGIVLYLAWLSVRLSRAARRLTALEGRLNAPTALGSPPPAPRSQP